GTNQIVFLRDGMLARHDLKKKTQIWSQQLIDPAHIQEQVKIELRETKAYIDRAYARGYEHEIKMPSPEEVTAHLTKYARTSQRLHISGQQIWVSSPEKLVHYDWDTGKPLKEIPLTDFSGHFRQHGDELVSMKENEAGQHIITHINLNTGETSVEEIG